MDANNGASKNAALLPSEDCVQDVESPTADSFLRQLSAGAANNAMEWTSLRFSIRGKAILDNVSGSVQPGEMACILGPSGAGKSTLLNILAGRMNTKAKGMSFTGDVSINGTAVDPVSVRANIAYVMQEDALLAMSTPRELLEMSAQLRLGLGRVEAAERAEELLAALKLEKCADTYVGNQLVRGLSGGEKKRTAVAVELITKPKMIFLDEPLSGLDSYAAWTMVQVLKQLASHGCAVVCTIHQPSSEIFQSFSKLICLADGKACYCGAVSALSDYMARVGHPVPNLYNPADHILFLVQKETSTAPGSFTMAWVAEEEKTVLSEIAELRRQAAGGGIDIPVAAMQTSCFTQLRFLVRREMREVVRNKIGLVMRFAVTGVMGALFSCIFLGVGKKNDTYEGLQSHFGAVCNVMIGSMFSAAQPLLLQFPFERPVFLREYAAKMYGCVPYFVAKTLVELPLSLLVAVENWALAYCLMGFQGNWFLLVLSSWGLSLTAASTALFVGCSVTNAQQAQELAPLLFVPQIIFSGVFITIDLIPKWLRWLQYVCALKYAINLGCIIEFAEVEGGSELMKHLDIYKDQTWMYVGILVAIFFGFRLLAMLNLRRRAKFVY